MEGRVSASGEAVLPLRVLAPASAQAAPEVVQSTEVEVVIDTGFTGYLMLPLATVSTLSLPFLGTTPATLADGSTAALDVYEARVVWHGRERPVDVLASEGGFLIGMALLYGSRLTMDVVPGGVVVIEERI